MLKAADPLTCSQVCKTRSELDSVTRTSLVPQNSTSAPAVMSVDPIARKQWNLRRGVTAPCRLRSLSWRVGSVSTLVG